jgi:chromosome partitioning protein
LKLDLGISSSKNVPTKVLVVLNGKGGVGKTTTAINLAAVFAEQYPVLLVDADLQGSASWWYKRSDQGMKFGLSQATDPKSLGNLRQQDQYELVVVDMPPALASAALQAVVPHADYVILPSPPAPMDLTALIETVKTVIKPTQVHHRVLLTRVDPRSLNEALEAQNTLLQLGVPACNSFIRAYKAHERAALDGLPITEWRGKHAKEAVADYRRVAEEIQRDWRQL